MSNLVWSPIYIVSDDLYVIDSGNRLYVGRSHDGTYLHVVSPSQIDFEAGEADRAAPETELERAAARG